MSAVTKTLAATVLTTLGLLGLTLGTALAAAPAATCESGTSKVLCSGSSSGPTTWYVHHRFLSYSYDTTYTSSGDSTLFNCNAGFLLTVTYSHVVGGVTEYSEPVNLTCNGGAWP